MNIIASLVSAGIDSLIFHPAETCIRRIQINEKILPYPVFTWHHCAANMHSIFQGMLINNVLKAAHRSLKYAGQPLITAQLQAWFPAGNPVFMHTVGGVITGSTAALLLTPLDTLKVGKQCSQDNAISYRTLWTLQKSHPYKAVGITLLRNSVGTGAFFATNSFLHHHVFCLDDGATLTSRQKLVNSVLCPTLGILASYPADLIKTHIQTTERKSYATREVAGQLMCKDGIKALYRGLIPKLATTAPRAAVSFFLFQSLQEKFRLYADSKKPGFAFFSPKQDAGTDRNNNCHAGDLRCAQDERGPGRVI